MKKLFSLVYLLLFAFCFTGFTINSKLAQLPVEDVEVKGKITNCSNESALSGALVKVIGTSKKTTTDANGKYSIKTVLPATLEFSAIGMTTIIVEVSAEAPINACLTAPL